MKTYRGIKSLLIFIGIFLSVEISLAQEVPLFQWAKSFGGNFGEEASAAKVDASGNVYITGFFVSATVDFDPGPATLNLTSSGSSDIFISKFDPNGNLIWARSLGGSDDDVAQSLALDNSGNVYITGYFNGTVDFDPGAGVFNLTSAGSADAFILKLNTNGDFVWAGQIGGTQYDQTYDVDVDDSGNVYATGYFLGTADFDPGIGTVNLTADDQDVFVMKLDNAGNFQWAKKFGGLETDRGRTLTIDGAGNVIITGGFYGYTVPFDFDPGPGTATLTPNTTSGQWDIYIMKLNNTNGDILWAKAIAGTLWDIDEAITVDNLDNILLTGYFEATTDFDPGAGVFELTAVGISNPYIVKLNSAGDFAWAKSFANSSSTGSPASGGNAITTDPSGNIYATGAFQRTVDFDPGPTVFNLVAIGQSDAYISKLDANGNFVWAFKIGTANSESARGIALTSTGDVYIAGLFSSIADFDPGACSFNLTSNGNIDAFIQKITVGPPPPDPTISSFSPTSGPVGTTVTLTGTNFSAIPANNQVAFFNNQVATVTASTPTSITTSVPVGATTGKISVTVGCVTATSTTDFTVTDNFVTRWNLATAGSGPTQLTFGTATSGTVNYTWQEISPGTASGSGSWSGSTLTITGLPTGATIRLQITPTNFQRIIINTGADRNRLTRVEQWGTTVWSSMQNAFRGCSNLQVTATDLPDLSGLSDLSGMFSMCGTLNSPSNIGSWNTSGVTNMSGLFSLAGAFNQNISSWNTGSVTNMSGLFGDATAFNQDIGTWNTAAVTNMAAMFAGAIVFNRNIGTWNTAAVTDMNSMFFSAYAFNQNISGWNTAAVTNMSSMFGYDYAFNQNIGSWNTSAVTNMSRMFEDAFAFNQNIGTWNTSAVTNMRGMFIDAYAFNQNIGTWNTSAVTDMSRMFDFATSFNQNIGTWNTAAVTDMSGMFADASDFNQNLGTWSLNPGVLLTGMLNNCNMDCNNYSATLIGWSNATSTPNSRQLGATGRQFGTDAVAARTNLVSNKLWTITGDTPSGSACGSTVLIPTITGFSPASGPVGTTVTITGTNFSTTPADNDVQFNGTSATVSASSSGSITCTVPVGASTGPISVTVAGNTDISTVDFTVTTASITITTQPQSATVCDGAIVNFTTAATGTTNIAYQWQIRDSDGAWVDVTDVDGYSGATTSVLTINTSGIFGEGSYQCRVSGDFASDVESDEVFLDIGPNPPSVTDVVNCGPGAVTVTASGGSNGQYRWYTQASGGTAIPGEINSMFTTPFLTSTTSYYVAIDNGFCEGPRSEVQVAISTCEPQPGFVWGQGIGVGTMSNGTNQGSTILIDADGNLLVCGGFQGTIDFDNGPAIVNLTAGNTDAFLLKMTPTGELLWAKDIGGPGSGNDGVSEMSIDGSGNIYMFFTFNGTADFDPGTGVASLTSTPSSPVNKNDLAVAKYDRDGNFVWVRRIGGNNDERSAGLKADAAGNVYITGQFRGTTNFNGSFPLTALGANSTDVLFAMMDTNGTFLWAGNVGSPLATAANLFSDGGSAIDVDGAGNVYVSGRVYGPNTTIDFDPGAGNVPQPIINDNVAFLLKLNNSGVYQNHYIVDGASGNVVRIDASDNIYITGAFTGTVDIDPGAGTFNVTGDGANYITKLNSSGNFVWGKVLEPNGFGVSPSVAIGGIVFDAIGDLHLTGYITTTTDFDLGPLVEARGLNGLFILNPFIWKLNANGEFNWVTNMRRISGSASATIYSVAVSPTGDIYSTGRYARTVDLDPGLCEFAVTNVNGSNIFISKFSPAQPNVCFAQQPISVTVCENDIAAFSVSVSDGASIFYQWQKFNTLTSQFENIDDSEGFSGTATNELTVNTTGNFGAGEYRCKVSGTSTVSEFSTAATLALSAITAPATSEASGCSGATLTLTASGGVNGEYRWYTLPTGGTPLAGASDDNYTTPALTSTTTYYVSLNNGSCESVRTPVTATIDTQCLSLTITSQPSAATVCSNAIATFITAAVGTTNITYQWQYSADGLAPFTDIANGGAYSDATTSTLTVNTTGNFGAGFYRCNISGDLATSVTTDEAELTVQAIPSAPATTSAERCGDGVVTLTALGGTSGQYRWYTVSSGGTAIPGEVNNAYTTPVLAATTTYYTSVANGSCESPRIPVIATITPIPSASVTGASACPGSTVTLNASGGTNGQYKWYTDASTPSPLTGEANNSYTTPALVQTTTYFVTVTSNGCESSRTSVAATIVTSGCAPEIEVASLSTVVEGTIVIDLKPLITTSGTLDVNSIKVLAGPESGALTSIENGILTITYSGVNFGGIESITVEACNTNGLCGQQDFTIEVNGAVLIFNALSPNDDGKNEIFLLQFIDALPSTKTNTVSIYNRWGDEVFSISDYDNNTRVFSGRNKQGNKVPAGTYYYKIHFPLQDKTVTGYISVKY